MRAALWHGREDIRIEDVEEPEVRPGTVKVKVAWCGICGTDVHEYLEGPIFIPAPGHPHPLSGLEPPVILGHEFSGRVVELGAGVDDLEVGDAVTVEPIVACDECPSCREGKYNTCQRIGFLGLGGGGGGLSENVVVERRWAHPVGDIPLDHAAMFEPLSVAHRAVVRSEAAAGDLAVVGGAGPIGLLVAAVLKGIGARTVLVEVADQRKAVARAAGVADLVLDPTSDDVGERVMELTDGRGADKAFECAGAEQVLEMCMDVVKPGGVVVNVAIWGHRPAVDMVKLVVKELDLRGMICYRRDHPATIELVRSGAVNLEPFITNRIGLEDLVEKGIRTLADDKAAVKVLVHP